MRYLNSWFQSAIVILALMSLHSTSSNAAIIQNTYKFDADTFFYGPAAPIFYPQAPIDMVFTIDVDTNNQYANSKSAAKLNELSGYNLDFPFAISSFTGSKYLLGGVGPDGVGALSAGVRNFALLVDFADPSNPFITFAGFGEPTTVVNAYKPTISLVALPSPVPLPVSAPLFGMALLTLTAFGFGRKGARSQRPLDRLDPSIPTPGAS